MKEESEHSKILRAISNYAKSEVEEANKEKKSKRKQVSIDPESVIGKEIMYQTTLLQEILFHLGAR